MTRSTMGEVALEYASGGGLVLPLHTPDPAQPGGCSCRRRDCGDHAGKHPRVMRGMDDATSDVETVTRWWAMWPTANIGIRPHPGQVVVDVDPRHGGAAQLVAMQRRYGRLPSTRTAATGGRGWHLWFRFDGEVIKQLAPGIDLKDHNGYAVAPPSLHLSGDRYVWTNRGDIAPVPDYLAGLIARTPIPVREPTAEVTERRLHGLVRHVATAPSGTRNGRLYWAAARLHEAGADVAPVIEAAVSAGLSLREAQRTAASAASAPGQGGVA